MRPRLYVRGGELKEKDDSREIWESYGDCWDNSYVRKRLSQTQEKKISRKVIIRDGDKVYSGDVELTLRNCESFSPCGL